MTSQLNNFSLSVLLSKFDGDRGGGIGGNGGQSNKSNPSNNDNKYAKGENTQKERDDQMEEEKHEKKMSENIEEGVGFGEIKLPGERPPRYVEGRDIEVGMQDDQRRSYSHFGTEKTDEDKKDRSSRNFPASSLRVKTSFSPRPSAAPSPTTVPPKSLRGHHEAKSSRFPFSPSIKSALGLTPRRPHRHMHDDEEGGGSSFEVQIPTRQSYIDLKDVPSHVELGSMAKRGLYSVRFHDGETPTTSDMVSQVKTEPRRPKPPLSAREVSTPIVRERENPLAMCEDPNVHTKSIQEIAHQYEVNLKNGLSEVDVNQRRAIFGWNELKKEKGVSLIGLFLSHLFGALNFVLLIAGLASVITAAVERSFDWFEGVIIFAIIISNTIIGFIQEWKSARAMQSLMKLFAPEAKVIREGTIQTIPARNLVPGDVVFIDDGDFVPADLRLIEAINLNIDEAFLTGESEPVAKGTNALKLEDSKALGDRTNLAYMSSVVTGGRGKGIVVFIGESTALGDIAKKLRSTKHKKSTQLQKSMSRLGIALFVSAIALSFLVLAIQVLAIGTVAFTYRSSWLYIVALCVAMIPEGLPAVLALTLAIGMQTMAKKKAVVKKMNVLESLNWITDICSDKTGTLTEGKMVVCAIWVDEKRLTVTGKGIIPEGKILDQSQREVIVSKEDENDTLLNLFRGCALCNMATLTNINEEWQATSSPTEIALQVLAFKVGLGKPTLEKEFRFLGEYPFDSNWKRMSVVYAKTPFPFDPTEDTELVNPEDIVLFVKGSVEALIPCCNRFASHGEFKKLTPEFLKAIQNETELMASEGLRVLAVGMKVNFEYTTDMSRQHADEDSIFLGLVGLMDPPRVESKPAVEKAKKAGINVYMLTGDHKLTAENIAKRVGIIKNELYDTAMLGTDFEMQKIPVDEFPKVIARCNPNTKIKMIDELHEQERFVCMTGDGVNDAPAIKKSDVGVAMGINGSEVTKSAADVVLMDDNFGTIIIAIEEGRRIFANIYKIVMFLMTNNFSEIITLVIGVCLSFFVPNMLIYPLAPIQILWLNVVTGTPICLCLGMEPASSDVMNEPPKKKEEGLFNLEMNIDILVYGLYIGIVSLINFSITFFGSGLGEIQTFAYTIPGNLYVARAVCFVTMVFCLLFHGLNSLHRRKSLMLHRFRRKGIIFTVLLGGIATLFTIYIPWVNVVIFKHYYLFWIQWIQVVVALMFFIIFSELYKLVKNLAINCYRSGRKMTSLAEQVTTALTNIDAKMGDQSGRRDRNIV